MSDHKSKKQFLKLPKYPGGGKALAEFISGNIHYPEAALEARVEGSVIVEYDISDNGDVVDQRILKGLGYGCDEEALRVVGLLKFEKVRNRGVRVKMTTKTTIHFNLPGTRIIYSVSEKKGKEKVKEKPVPKNNGPVTYGYTINF